MTDKGVKRILKFTAPSVVCLLLASAFSMLLLSICTLSNNTCSNNTYSTHLGCSGVPPPYYEVIATVTSMQDGDTTWVRIENIVVELDPAGEVYEGNSESVRYGGGIDAPESYAPGGPESTAFIENLIPVGTTVYLDLDDYAVGGRTGRPYRGKYERLIAVIYAVIDSQWVNINAELLRWGMEAYPDHDWDKYTYITSEFSVYEWPPYDNDYPYVLGFVPAPEVEVSISTRNGGRPGENVTFTVTVTNETGAEDTFILAVHSEWGWPADLPSLIGPISDNSSDNVALTVTIPESASYGDEDTITVTVTSIENAEVSSSASCIVHARPTIYIDGNSYLASATSVTSGSGTAEDPYVIENLNFDALSYHGIYIRDTNAYFVIRNCYVYNGNNGIYFHNVMNGKIDNVTSTNNSYGIVFYSSSNNFIENCTVMNNQFRGISFLASSNNRIMNCTVENNRRGIVFMISSNNNHIYHNRFINNETQAHDDSSNYWDNGYPSGGNYWSNYAGVDANGDGIGDTPHDIGGGGSNQDRYPFASPVVRGIEVLISPSENEGLPGETLTYTVTVKNISNTTDSYILTDGDTAGWELELDNLIEVPENDNRTTTLTVTIPVTENGCTWDNIWIKATSMENNDVWDNESCRAHVTVIRRVDVSISPSFDNALPGENVTFTVTVKNEGNVPDTHLLTVEDNAGWGAWLDENTLAVPAGDNTMVILSVTVPSDAEENESTRITVTATSRADSSVSVSGTCTAVAGKKPEPVSGFPVIPVAISAIIAIIACLAVYRIYWAGR